MRFLFVFDLILVWFEQMVLMWCKEDTMRMNDGV